ncbi:MAG: DedA family protein [Alphaproteobacteria bacterium]|nr:DedA family protein [Alphaproteobacteria bacterium]
MESFIQKYGYFAVFLGSTIEGELILMTAGYFAYMGVLDLSWVILFAFLGTLIADQGCFFIGRYYGPRLLERFPTLKKKSDKVFRLLHAYKNLFIMTFRFVYGIRIASPLIIGASQLSPKRFTILNFPAALIWAIVIAWIGYFFGGTFEVILDNMHRIQRYGLFVGAPIAVSIWAVYKVYLKHYRD